MSHFSKRLILVFFNLIPIISFSQVLELNFYDQEGNSYNSTSLNCKNLSELKLNENYVIVLYLTESLSDSLFKAQKEELLIFPFNEKNTIEITACTSAIPEKGFYISMQEAQLLWEKEKRYKNYVIFNRGNSILDFPDFVPNEKLKNFIK